MSKSGAPVRGVVERAASGAPVREETTMTDTTTTRRTSPSQAAAACTTERRITRSPLGYGVLAGPFYVIVSLAQAVSHDGFDLSRHEWSLLAAGPGGWNQGTNPLLPRLMGVAAAGGTPPAVPAGAAGRG